MFTLDVDFSGSLYKEVLGISLESGCNYFEFCIRHDIDFLEDSTHRYEKSAYQLIDDLECVLVSKRETNSWVTGLIISSEKQATVYRYKFNHFSLKQILRYSDSVSDWCGPNLPEDLVLFQDEKPWLGTIGHEALSFWFLTNSERERIAKLGLELFEQ